MDDGDDGFTFVGRRGKPRRPNHEGPRPVRVREEASGFFRNAALSPPSSAPARKSKKKSALVARTESEVVEQALLRLEALRSDCLPLLSWLQHLLPPGIVRVTGLGLGSPCASRNALTQLAVLLDVCPTAAISAYDPVFSTGDRALLHATRCQAADDAHFRHVTLEGLVGSPRRHRQRTLLYMPHCDRELYEAALEANWDDLESIVIIGNSFESYRLRVADAALRAESPRLFEVRHASVE